MNKKNRRPKISKPNLPRSKNNPSGKKNDPDIDWSKYAEGRKSGGRNCVERMAKTADHMRKLLGLPKGERDRRVSAVPAAVLKSEENLSYWGLVKHFAKHPGDLERRGLDRPYGKSWYRLRISQTDDFMLHEIIGRVAGDAAARGANIADSTGFRHIQVPGLAQRHVRHYKREAVRKTARRARPRGQDMRRGGHAGRGKRLAVFEGDAGRDAARVQRHAGRLPIRRSQKLPGGTGRCTPPYNRAQTRPYNRGRRRPGGDVGVSRGTPRHLPQAVAETKRRRERLLAREGRARGRGAGRRGENPGRRVAVRLHMPRHGFRIKVAARCGGRRRPPHVTGEPALECTLKLPETGGGASFSGMPGGADHGGSAPPFCAGRSGTAWPALRIVPILDRFREGSAGRHPGGGVRRYDGSGTTIAGKVTTPTGCPGRRAWTFLRDRHILDKAFRNKSAAVFKLYNEAVILPCLV